MQSADDDVRKLREKIRLLLRKVRDLERDQADLRKDEMTWRRTEATLRGVFRATPVGLCTMHERVFRAANRAWYDITGYTDQEIIGNTTRMLYADDEEYERVGRELYGRVPDRGVTAVKTRLRRKDGVFRDVVLRAASLGLEDFPDLTVVAIEDITDRGLTEQALKETEEMYRTLLETSPDPIVVYSLSGEFIAASRQVARIYGAESVGEFLAEVRTVFDLLDDEGAAAARANFALILAAGHSRNNEYRIRVRGGKTISAEVNSSLIRDADGNAKAFISVLRDITERKRSEKILLAQRDLGLALARATSLEDSLPLCLEAAIAAVGFDAGGIYIHDTVAETFLLACVTGVSRDFAELVHHYGAGSERARILWEGRPLYLEGAAALAACNGEDVIAEGIKTVAVIPIRNQEKVIGSLNLASRHLDIIPAGSRDALETIASQIGTALARLHAEEHLRESEGKFRDLAEKSIVGIYLIQDGLFKYVNGEMAAIFGHNVQEIIDRMGPREVIYPEDLPMVEENIRKRICGELKSLRYEFRIITRDGQVRNAEVFSSQTLYRGRPAVIGTLLDVTERRQVEEELRRLSIAVEQAAEDVIITDPEGFIQYVNPAFETITGYSRMEAVGRTPRFLKSDRHDAVFYEHLWRTIKNGEIWTGRITNRCKNGKLIQEDTTISPLTTSTGKLMGYVALKRDVTESMRMEAQLRQAQKMEAIGTLAGGIAHDFNNILGAMMGYAELAKFKTADKKIHPYLEQILKACDRSRDLVKQILTFSRQQEQEKRPVAVTPIVKEAMKLLRSSLPATVEIRQTYANRHDTVLADPTQIHQVLINLCTNALHAMRNREGVLDVRLEEQLLSPEDPPYDPELREGAYLKLTVSDTGEGIDPVLKDKIFDPFFTTKDAGEGTGLGLSVVYGIVKDYGGVIAVESEPSQGTVFTIYLPLLDADGRHEEKEMADIPRGRGRILLVDDEEPIASLGWEMLSSLGYEVAVRFSSHDALAAFRVHPERFDLVITDMTMPNMTGAGLAREMLKLRPDLPIILTTGFSERIDEEEAKKIGIREFLMKPVSLADLARAVKAQLDIH